jgi:hypothetical protein
VRDRRLPPEPREKRHEGDPEVVAHARISIAGSERVRAKLIARSSILARPKGIILSNGRAGRRLSIGSIGSHGRRRRSGPKNWRKGCPLHLTDSNHVFPFSIVGPTTLPCC